MEMVMEVGELTHESTLPVYIHDDQLDEIGHHDTIFNEIPIL